jgi:hypothetical protein
VVGVKSREVVLNAGGSGQWTHFDAGLLASVPILSAALDLTSVVYLSMSMKCVT